MEDGQAPGPRSIRVAAWLAWFVLAGLLLWLTADRMESGEGHARRFFGVWRTRHLGSALLCAWAGTTLLFCGRSRQRWTRAILLNLGLLAGLLAAQLLGVVGLVDWSRAFGARNRGQPGISRVPNLEVKGHLREDLAIAWGIPREPIPFSFVTDSRGFRNAADRERADLYCLGDSMLVSGLVPFEETLIARLERGLGRDVMSLALVGLGPRAELELLRETAVPIDGALVLQFVFEGNDLQDTANERGARSDESPVAGWRASFMGRLISRLQAATQPSLVQTRTRKGLLNGEPYWFRWAGESFRGFEGEVGPLLRALEETAAQVRAHGGEYALVLIPMKLRVLGPRCEFAPDSELKDLDRHLGLLPAVLVDWSRISGVPYLDLTPALVDALNEGRVPWFQADTHWNAAGQTAAAEALLEWEPVRRLLVK